MFTEPLFSIPAILIMIAGFIGLKVVSGKQRTLASANAIAAALLVVILVCAGTLFWFEFLRDVVTDKVELGKMQRANSFQAQAYGIAKKVGSAGKVCVIATSMTEESSIDGFVEGLKEGGFTDVEVKYIDNKKGGYTRIPAPEGMPMMPMMPQYSANDVKNAAKGADVIISVATLPQLMGRGAGISSRDDMTQKGKVIFVSAGDNQYPQNVLRQMLKAGYITYAVAAKSYLPQYDRLDNGSDAVFEEFYGIYGQNDTIPDIKDED